MMMGVFFVILIVGLLAAWAPAAGAQQPVDRSFSSVVVSADVGQHTLRIRHKPTGYETVLRWDEKSKFTVNERDTLDELPEGQWMEVVAAQIDAQAIVGSASQSDRFLWDLRRLVADRIESSKSWIDYLRRCSVLL
ncbi:MAG: hypothetical protein WCI73_09230, partial [Phycisphaerae bacterium]